MSHVGVFKDCRLRSELVNIGRMNAAGALAENSVHAQLVRKKNNQVRLARKFGWLRSKPRGEGNAGRAECGRANKMTTREIGIHRK